MSKRYKKILTNKFFIMGFLGFICFLNGCSQSGAEYLPKATSTHVSAK